MNFQDADPWNDTTRLDVYGYSTATHIPDGIFQRFPHLSEVNIGTKLTTINRDDFKDANELIKLELQHNDIHIVPRDAFAELTRLERLSFSGSHIKTIEDFAFNGLSQLVHLILERNYLTEIKRNTFAGLMNLESLDLSSNRISTIEEDAFSLPKLQYLFLHRNPIIDLPNGFFNGMPNLVRLVMGSDNLSNIDRSLYNLEQLKSLRMSDNAHLVLDFEALLQMPALEQLDLEKMRIEVPTQVVTPPSQSSLTDLRLHRNNINASDIMDRLKAFHLLKLEKLNLKFNNLCDLIELTNLHAHFPQLKELELGSNPMPCSIFDAIHETLKAQQINLMKYSGACRENHSSFC